MNLNVSEVSVLSISSIHMKRLRLQQNIRDLSCCSQSTWDAHYNPPSWMCQEYLHSEAFSREVNMWLTVSIIYVSLDSKGIGPYFAANTVLEAVIYFRNSMCVQGLRQGPSVEKLFSIKHNALVTVKKPCTQGSRRSLSLCVHHLLQFYCPVWNEDEQQ